jgi:hypothetical protein
MPRSKRVTEEATCVILTGNAEAEPHDTVPQPFGFKLRYGVTGGRVSAWGGISIKQLPAPSPSGGKDGA